jgi:hypothetical protein
MLKNMRSFEVSSGDFSCIWGCAEDESDAVEGVVEASGESSKDPDDAEAIINDTCGMGRKGYRQWCDGSDVWVCGVYMDISVAICLRCIGRKIQGPRALVVTFVFRAQAIRAADSEPWEDKSTTTSRRWRIILGLWREKRKRKEAGRGVHHGKKKAAS